MSKIQEKMDCLPKYDGNLDEFAFFEESIWSVLYEVAIHLNGIKTREARTMAHTMGPNGTKGGLVLPGYGAPVFAA